MSLAALPAIPFPEVIVLDDFYFPRGLKYPRVFFPQGIGKIPSFKAFSQMAKFHFFRGFFLFCLYEESSVYSVTALKRLTIKSGKNIIQAAIYLVSLCTICIMQISILHSFKLYVKKK